MNIVFFKVSKEKELEKVETSKKRIHYRRSLIIQDKNSQKLWLINGSKVTEEIKRYGLSQAKKLNAKCGFTYQIKEIEPLHNDKTISLIFNKKLAGKIQKQKTTKSTTRKPFVISNQSYSDSSPVDSHFENNQQQIVESKVEKIKTKSKLKAETTLDNFASVVQLLNDAIRRESTKEEISSQINIEVEKFLSSIYSS